MLPRPNSRLTREAWASPSCHGALPQHTPGGHSGPYLHRYKQFFQHQQNEQSLPIRKQSVYFTWPTPNPSRRSHRLHPGECQYANAFFGVGGGYLFAGAFTGNPFADFLLGDPLLFLQVGGDGTREYRNREYTYFIQDSFSLTPHFTLYFGLRHEIFYPIFDKGLRMSAFRPGQQSVVRPTVPPDVVFPGDPGIPPSTYPRDLKDLGPRIGIAWDPFKTAGPVFAPGTESITSLRLHLWLSKPSSRPPS